MIVDDDVYVRKCLRKLVQWDRIGYVVVAEAGDGMEGIQLFNATKPDVIITDLKMPGMDGETFCQKIRNISDKVLIIFLSAYESFTAAQLSLRCGVSDYILKPIDTKKIEQITDILIKLSETFQNFYFLNDLVCDDELRKQFVEQLRNGNVDYFTNLFKEMSEWSDFNMVQLAASAMLELLFSVTDSDTTVKLDRQGIFDTLKCFSNKMDITSFTSEIFSEYLKKNNSNTKNNFEQLIIAQIKQYVIENIGNSQLNVSLIAEYFSFSDDYMGRIFKKYTDVSLNSYITHIRINQACRLLRNTRFTISEIAQMVGYNRSNYFGHVFKKQLGMTPNEYRNMKQ